MVNGDGWILNRELKKGPAVEVTLELKVEKEEVKQTSGQRILADGGESAWLLGEHQEQWSRSEPGKEQ